MLKSAQAEALSPVKIALEWLHLEILVASPIRVVLLSLHLQVQAVSLIQVDSHAPLSHLLP